LSAADIDRCIRAFNPVPGAAFLLAGAPVKVWRAEVLADSGGEPGRVLVADRDGVVVACGSGALRLLELQKAGGKRLSVANFLAGTPLSAGLQLAG
jgi:methionyl-tRNA formyltransferase